MRGDVHDRPRSRNGAHAGALALAVAIVVLTGCGGGGDGEDAGATSASPEATSTSTTAASGNGGPSRLDRIEPQQQVREAVEAVLTSSDPADTCVRFVTGHYLQRAYGGPDGCIQAQSPAAVADQLDFRSVRVDGDRATAVVVPSGGPYDGKRVTVSLVRQDPGWAVDELDANIPVGP